MNKTRLWVHFLFVVLALGMCSINGSAQKKKDIGGGYMSLP